jgi:[acyl-carrier-protein] S-malonyltransferase
MLQPKIAFVFPGQGSQIVGMGREIAAAFPVAQDVFSEADQILGYALSDLAWNGPEEQLNDTFYTQPALLVHSIASLRVLQHLHQAIIPAFVAGHSMGEISALVACNALSFRQALLLAAARGKLMKEAGLVMPGGMAAILGLDIPTLEKICLEASTKEEIVQVANDNCPGQVVISGSSNALDRAIVAAQQAGARRAVRLAVSIAAHSPLMTYAQVGFNMAVEESGLVDPQVPLVGNVTAQPLYTAAQVKEDLQGQLTNRVRWTESILQLTEQGVTSVVELGTGSVLGGLIKRIAREINYYQAGTPADFEKML